MKVKGAFSLVEVLVIIAIVAIVVAISFPVIQNTKEKAKEAKSVSNMRQLYVAIELYRVDYGGIPFGTMGEMGLPPWPMEKYMGGNVRKLHPPNRPEGFSYYYYPFPEHIDRRNPTWEDYVRDHEGDTVLLADITFNPNRPSGGYPRYHMDPNVEKYVIGINLNGGIRRKRASGGLDLKWWDR